MTVAAPLGFFALLRLGVGRYAWSGSRRRDSAAEELGGRRHPSPDGGAPNPASRAALRLTALFIR